MEDLETDGVYTGASEADMIYFPTTRRYGVLVTAKNGTNTNHTTVASMHLAGRAVWVLTLPHAGQIEYVIDTLPSSLD